jgi:hypothetical protein
MVLYGGFTVALSALGDQEVVFVRKKLFHALISLALVLGAGTNTARASSDEYLDGSEKPSGPEDGTNFAAVGGRQSFQLTFVEGERALKQGKIDKAILYLRKSVNSNEEDLDARVCLAEALEQKLATQTDKDPDMYRECIENWLHAFRDVPPDEAGASVLKFAYRDEEREMPAKKHLKKLTGTLPRPFETNKGFLDRVCKDSAASVHAKVIKRPKHDEFGEEK